tara:strand:+ start:58 stop:1848 length:1791 start_codon:yes stop_codon:yes gene_type:complete
MLALLTACSAGPPQESGASCSDGADNDADGLYDCADPSCAEAEACIEIPQLAELPVELEPLTEPLGLPPLKASGVSLVDFDDDGLPDLTIAAKEGLQVLRNRGDWQFEDAADALGLDDAQLATRLELAHAVIWVDIDDDGDLDLFMTRRLRTSDITAQTVNAQPPALLMRGADGRLQDFTAQSGLELAGYWEGAAFGDLDGDGDLDLVMLGGIDPEGNSSGGMFSGTPARLWRNEGGGLFSDFSAASNCTGPADGESWQTVILDLDGDGDQDILQANDFQNSTLCVNDGSGYFSSWQGSGSMDFSASAMGLSVGDLTGDGCLEIYVTNFAQADATLNFDGQGNFTEVYLSLLGSHPDPSPPLSGYGVSLSDVDLDGDQDLLWVAAYDLANPAQGQLPGALKFARNRGDTPDGRLIYQQPGSAVMLDGIHNAYGLAHGDLDGDGDLDYLVGVDRDPPGPEDYEPPLSDAPIPLPEVASSSFLLRNNSELNGRNFLSIRLRQPTPNPRAVGAVVRVSIDGKLATRAVMAGSSYNSSHAYPLHFGLGEASRPDWVQVTWPDGHSQLFTELSGGVQQIERGSEGCIPAGSCAEIEAGCLP